MHDQIILPVREITEDKSPLDSEEHCQTSSPVKDFTTLSNADLCSTCQTLLELKEYDKPIAHHPNSPALKEAASNGCPYCIRLLDVCISVQDRMPDKPAISESSAFKVALIYRDDNDCMMHQFRRKYDNSNENDQIINMELIPVTDATLPTVFKNNSSTGAEDTVNTAKSWIQNCLKSHPQCAPEKSWFPNRIIEVGTIEEPFLRLRIKAPEDTAPYPSYVSLSHCWGNLKFKQLTRSSLEAFTDRILLEELPKTFQEAIFLTRSLGLQYLWIDSLCIIQDSFEDWTQESAEMENIYQYAACNIAATAAKDGSCGLFYDRDPTVAEVCRVHIPSLPNETSPLGLYDIICQGMWTLMTQFAPLNRRAWVLQEQYLSRRLIHCSKSQLAWECRELAACEMYPAGFPGTIIYDDYCFAFKWMGAGESHMAQYLEIGTSKELDFKHYLNRACRRWNRLVSLYSRRTLTKEEDKLVAISGVARALQGQIQEDIGETRYGYLAGLWGQFLPLQLLWTIYQHLSRERPAHRPKSYRAPSWSWASLDGPISSSPYNMPQDQRFMIRINDAHIATVGPDQFGQVTKGHLNVTGWLHPFELNLDELKSWFVGRENFAAVLSPDVPSEFEVGKKIYFLPILERKEYSDCLKKERNSFFYRTVIEGLILQQAEAGESVFSRLGTFHCAHEFVHIFRKPTYGYKHVLVSDSGPCDVIPPPVIGADLVVIGDGPRPITLGMLLGFVDEDNKLVDPRTGLGREWVEKTFTFI